MIQDTSTALALPDEQQFKKDMAAINRFQQIVHANMIQGQDYGIIPGTQKPTLLKPGAEKIAKLLGLCDCYAILDKQEDWGKSFFRYLIKCSLITAGSGIVVSEGLGECNSLESKYRYRWLFSSQLPKDFDKDKAVMKWTTLDSGAQVPQYRVDNEDIFSQVNTILKMAKKRALVDASLSAGRLSNVFTQDMEDQQGQGEGGEGDKTSEEENWCSVHKTNWFKKGKMQQYAHPIKGTKEWCNKPKKEEVTPASESKEEDSIAGDVATTPTDAGKPPDDLPKAEDIKTIGQLMGACFHHFKMLPEVVVKELGYKDKKSITDPAGSWEFIKALKVTK